MKFPRWEFINITVQNIADYSWNTFHLLSLGQAVPDLYVGPQIPREIMKHFLFTLCTQSTGGPSTAEVPRWNPFQCWQELHHCLKLSLDFISVVCSSLTILSKYLLTLHCLLPYWRHIGFFGCVLLFHPELLARRLSKIFKTYQIFLSAQPHKEELLYTHGRFDALQIHRCCITMLTKSHVLQKPLYVKQHV